MKHLSIIIVVFAFWNSQILAQKASASDYLNINNVNMMVYSNSEIIRDTLTYLPNFEIPKGTGTHTLYEAGLWAMGINAQTKNIHGFALFANPDLELQEGPIASNYNSAWKNRYGKLWKVTKAQIDLHKLLYTSPGYNPISVIADWPAHGDTTNGEPYYLAPFIDINQDGSYNPFQGDYPCIKGDQAIYAIAHDDGSTNLHNSLPFSMDIHLMAYSFSTNNALNNTVFLEYQLVNRSFNDYQDMRIGMFQDLDIGCSFDDFIGCDTILNTFYAYNGDSFDEDCNPMNGYGINPPVMGTIFLNQQMSSFIYFNNTGVINGNPTTENEFYNYMNATWRNGQHMITGGNGIPGQSGAGSKTNFMYPGDVNDTLTWTDLSAGNAPNDRRGIGSIGPFNFASGNRITIDLAMLYSRDTSKSNFENVTTFKNDAAFVKQFYNSQNFNCTFWATGIEPPNRDLTINLYPNPTVNEVFLEWSANDKVKTISSFDSNGRKIFEYTPKDENTLKVNVETWTNGLYLFKIESENGIAVRKLVVE